MSSQRTTDLVANIEQHLSVLTRRKFLLRGAQGAMLITTAGLAACSDKQSQFPPAKYLSQHQVAFFHHLANVLLPTNNSELTSVSDVPIVDTLDHVFSYSSEEIRSNLGTAIKLFEYGGWVIGGHFSRFTKLEAEEAVEYIDQWQNGHPIQQGIATILKKLVYASYWQEESTWPPLEFDGPVSDKWGLKSLGEAPLPKA